MMGQRGIGLGSSRGIQLVIIAFPLLLIAVYPAAIAETLALAGMDPRVARLAGSRLAVMMAFSGAGLLLLGVTFMARSGRLRRSSQAMAETLSHLPGGSSGRVQVIEGVGAGLTAEFAGLRMEVVVEPEQGGQVWVRARCPAALPLSVWPRGLGRSDGPPVMASGRAWECMAKESIAGFQDLDGLLNQLFEDGSASYLHQNHQGVEVCMPNAPAEDLLNRLKLAIDAAAGLARTNR